MKASAPPAIMRNSPTDGPHSELKLDAEAVLTSVWQRDLEHRLSIATHVPKETAAAKTKLKKEGLQMSLSPEVRSSALAYDNNNNKTFQAQRQLKAFSARNIALTKLGGFDQSR